ASITALQTPWRVSHSNSSRRPSALSANVAAAAAERIATLILSLETSMPTSRPFCAILQLPSLLGTGFTPMQLFGLKEDIGLSLAPSQALPLGSTGSGRRRAAASTAARSRILPNFPDTRGHRLHARCRP